MGLTAGSKVPEGYVGKQNAPKDIGRMNGFILVPSGEGGFEDDALALKEASWLDKINKADSRYIRLPLAFDIENKPEEDKYNTSSIGNVAFVDAGKLTQDLIVDVTPFVRSQLNTLNGFEWDLFKTTTGGYILGTSNDKIKFEPYTLSNFRVGSLREADGSVNATIPITITHADPKEDNLNPSFINPSVDGVDASDDPAPWNIMNVVDIKAIKSEVPSATATEFPITLKGYDGVPFELAVKENIIVTIKSTGVVVPLTDLVEDANTPGLYLATGAFTLVPHLIGMAAAGAVGAVQGFAGLVSDLVEVTPA